MVVPCAKSKSKPSAVMPADDCYQKDDPDKTVGHLLIPQALIQRNPTEQSYNLLDQAMCVMTRRLTMYLQKPSILAQVAMSSRHCKLCVQPRAKDSFKYYLIPYDVKDRLTAF